ncbi:fumarylacetoacetate hydrolase family protein [Algoriphagus sp.]|uniref:fumarylacetoacetate hydrolase family protein n=1 Tax=Algoriphagus sp. TaxID=1872435 RepID=UPI003F7202DF
MTRKLYLTRHDYQSHSCWAVNGKLLPQNFTLNFLLELTFDSIVNLLMSLPTDVDANETLLSPIEKDQEIWGSGVTYAHSRDARELETSVKNIYEKVYDAFRPELFFKAIGWRAVGHKGNIRIRRDTTWNVPEPELVVVTNSRGQIVGYTVGNDVSSRDIEGENPLYLPQAKCYDGSCAIGPGILITEANELRNLPVELSIFRDCQLVCEGSTLTSNMKRSFEELVKFQIEENTFPNGFLLMTGTGIVPPDEFSLQIGDKVCISIGDLTLENEVV